MNGVRGQVAQYHAVIAIVRLCMGHKRGLELVPMTQEISASHSVNKKVVSVTVIGMMVRMKMSSINICHDQIHWFLGKYCGRELANMILYAANGCRRHIGSVSSFKLVFNNGE